MLNTTISYLSTVLSSNGTKLNDCNNPNELLKYTEGKEKQQLPVLYPYRGTKGEYAPSNTFFIDIDTNEYVEDILANANNIFDKLGNILYMQKSYSGKLHLICVFEEQDTAAKWSYNATLHTVAILHGLKTFFGYDFFSIKGAVDTHSLKFTQALYVSSEDIIANPFGGGLVKYTANTVSTLTDMYAEYFEKKQTSKNLVPAEIDATQILNLDYFNETRKITVDKNLQVGGYNGNDLRWRIGRELYYLLGDEEKAKRFCEQHFTNANEIKIYTKYPENRIVKNWLLTTFHKTIVDNTPKTKLEGYLTEYYDDIKDLYNQNKRLLIKAPTGAGKTVLTKMLANEYNAVVIVPFNAMLKLYTKNETIIKDGESVDVKGLLEVSSTSDNAYTEDVPCVMVWDQARKHDLTNRLVISDETHQWFYDRTYRTAAVATMELAKRWTKLICISATPSGEQYTLQLPVFEFYKERKDIRTVVCHTNQPGEYMNEVIRSYTLNKTRYDRVCVFTDMFAQRLYQNNEGSVLIHSLTRNTQEFKDLLANERVTSDVTILTSLAFNGLNFLNENENILVVVDCEEGKDTANKIIQATGRFRKANVELLVIFKNKNSEEKQTLKEKRSDAVILSDYAMENDDNWITVDARLLDEDQYNAMNEIERYNAVHSTQENIIKELCECMYFTPIYHKYINNGARLEKIVLKKKHEENEQFVNLLNEDAVETSNLTDYQRGWNNAMSHISEQTDVDWKYLISSYKRGTLMDTIIEDVVFIIKVAKLTDEEFEKITSTDKLERLMDMGCSKVCLAKQKQYINKIKSIRAQWELFTAANMENDLDEFMQMFIGERMVIKNELKRKQSEGGKKTAMGGGNAKQTITIMDTITGEQHTFETKGECMKFLNTSSATFGKFLKGNSKLNARYTILQK